MVSPLPGDRVRHRTHGLGRVLRLSTRNRLLVSFDSGPLLPRTVDSLACSLPGPDDRPPREGGVAEATQNVNGVSREGTAPPGRRGATSSARVGSEGDGSARERSRVRRGSGKTTKTKKKVRRKTKGPARARSRREAPPKDARVTVRVPIDFPTARVRQGLEALRTGVVPAFHVQDYTVGRDRELADFRDLLAARRGLRLIWGDYGAGKTHLLDVLERIAREEHFLSARAILNPRDVPPSHPQRLYRIFLTSLRYPDDSGSGWRPLFEKLVDSPEHRASHGDRFSRFLSPVLFALHTGDEEAIGWASDYLEGYPMESTEVTRALRRVGWRGPNLLALSDYRTYGRMYVHMMGALSSWARDAGYRGLVLLMDEVERVDRLDAVHRRLAEEVLKHYAAATLPESMLRFHPGALYRGGHPVHRVLPITYDSDQPLAAVLAFTPLAETWELSRRIVSDEGVHLPLRPLSPRDLRLLVKRVARLYERGYRGFQAGEGTIARFLSHLDGALLDDGENPRHVVRGVVELLDLVRYGLD
ncbi:MAG: BREX system ATP-binding domain-containing protein, partial [Planctomycetota bacterium]